MRKKRRRARDEGREIVYRTFAEPYWDNLSVLIDAQYAELVKHVPGFREMLDEFALRMFKALTEYLETRIKTRTG